MATELSPEAEAKAAKAVELLPVAEVETPAARLLAPLAEALMAMAVALVPEALALVPRAKEESRLA